MNADLSSLGAFFDTYYDVIGAGYGIDSTLYDFAELEECGTIAAVPEPGPLLSLSIPALLFLLPQRARGSPRCRSPGNHQAR